MSTGPAAPSMPAHLPPDLVPMWQSYVEMFGAMPPLPAAKFDYMARHSPESLRKIEALRAHAFYNRAFDMKTTQLVLFGLLLVQSHGAAAHHAQAARRAGASWDELQAIVDLCSAVAALAPSNQGGNLLEALQRGEQSAAAR